MWCVGCQRGQKPDERGICPECYTRLCEPNIKEEKAENIIVKAVEEELEEPKPTIKEPIVVKKDEDKPQKAKRKMSEETKAKIREALKAKKDDQVS